MRAIKIWAVTLLRYKGPFLKWRREEIQQMNQRTIKLITMYKALHLNDNINILYVSRKEGARGLACIKYSVNASIQRLETKKRTEESRLL